MFRKKAESTILSTSNTALVKPSSSAATNSELNWLSGGLIVDDSNPETSLSNLRVRLSQALRFFDLRFK